MATIMRAFIPLLSYKKTLICTIIVVSLILIIESLFYVYTEPDESLLETILGDQFVKFEGKSGTEVHIPDVPHKSPEYDENWMDSYSEGSPISLLKTQPANF